MPLGRKMRKKQFLNSTWQVLPPLIVGEISKRSWKEWQRPRSGDLIYDAMYFVEKAEDEQDSHLIGRYARAAIVFSAAAVEAISNDALVSIYELLVDVWPSECMGREPWRSFKGRSEQPIVTLLNRGNLPKKIKYLLGHLKRITGQELTELNRGLKRIADARNRILHMAYLLKPNDAPSVLNARQALHLANLATRTASDYIENLAEGFEEIHLPIRTIRSEELVECTLGATNKDAARRNCSYEIHSE